MGGGRRYPAVVFRGLIYPHWRQLVPGGERYNPAPIEGLRSNNQRLHFHASTDACGHPLRPKGKTGLSPVLGPAEGGARAMLKDVLAAVAVFSQGKRTILSDLDFDPGDGN